jgi:hypothetical protein
MINEVNYVSGTDINYALTRLILFLTTCWYVKDCAPWNPNRARIFWTLVLAPNTVCIERSTLACWQVEFISVVPMAMLSLFQFHSLYLPLSNLQIEFWRKSRFSSALSCYFRRRQGQEMLHSKVIHKVDSIDVMKTLNINGGVAPPILNLGSRWRRVGSATPRPLYFG